MDPQKPPPRHLLRHAGFMQALARSLTRDSHRAEDLAQDAWLSILRRPPRHQLNLRGWLSTVLRRSARRDARVRSRREDDEHAAARPEALPSAADNVSHAEVLRHVTEAVLTLEEPYRQTLLERFYLGRSAAEIARSHGVPAATVRSRIKRALDELRCRLDRRLGSRNVWSTALLAIGKGGLTVSTSTKIAGATILVAGLVLIPILRKTPPQPERSDVAASAQAEELEPPELVPETEETVAAAESTTEREEVLVPVETPEPAATGSLRVQVVYKADWSPAAGIGVELLPWNARTSTLDRDSIHGGRRATTDEDGGALIQDLQPGSFWVDTDHRVDPYSADILAGEEAELLIELAGLDLEGLVVDENDVPVAGASVELAEWARVPVTVPKRVAVTDAAGRFEVRAVPTLCSIGARAAGHAPSAWYQILGGPGGRRELRLALQGPGGRLEGRVLGPDGEPVEDAAVLVGRLDIDLHTSTLPDGSAVIEARGQCVQTDADGAFELDDCPLGEVPVAVRAREPELAPWTGTLTLTERAPTVTEIGLEHGVILTGVVREASGEPAKRVEIEVKGSQPFADRNLVTAADGSYRLAAVPAGELEVTATTDERGKAAATLSGGAGETVEWNPQLSRGIELLGLVLDAADTPVPGGFVEAYQQDNNDWFGWTHVDDEGRFALGNCPAGGRLVVKVETQGHGSAKARDVDPSRLEGGELVLRLPAKQEPASVVGDVLLPDGSPATSATIRGTGRIYTTTQDTGRIAIEGLLPGTHTLTVEVAGYSRTRLGPKTLAPGETWDVGTVRIQMGGSLLLRVSDFPTRAYFQVFDAQGRWTSNMHPDEGTRETRLSLMEPGSYSLAVSGVGVAVQWIPFEILSEQEEVIEVELAAGIPAELHLAESVAVLLHLEREGTVLAHHWIPRREDLPTRWTSAGLVPGTYLAEVEAEDGRKGQKQFVVSAEDAPGPLIVELSFR